MLQADGGSVRVGKLRPTRPGEAGHGKLTPKTKRPRRTREDTNREVINFDVREPGSLDACMDVMVPHVAGDKTRWQHMVATAQRAGLGDNTAMRGLGDMGSSLATSFDEAFVGIEDAVYCADWKHICDYVTEASKYITHRRPDDWVRRMKDALWHRDRVRVEKLLQSARERRVPKLPSHLNKCPVATLTTYVQNNWDRFHAKAFKDADLDFVSARAECQVRERIKARFSNAGAWHIENVEGKAILRAIIADGRWTDFRDHYLRTRVTRFQTLLRERLEQAVAGSRLHDEALATLFPAPAPTPRMAA